MMITTDEAVPGGESLGELVRALDAAAPHELTEVCEAWLRGRVGALWSGLMLADYGETVLEPVAGRVARLPADGYPVSGSSAGTAYLEQRSVCGSASSDTDRPADGELVAYLPVTIRTERLGVLAVGLPTGAGNAVPAVLLDAAQVLAYVLTGARRYTDRFEALRRRKDLGLPAEIQWELLPVLAYELPAFSIAGALEPTYDIGGDTFDYAVSATTLTATITDAVGHGLRSALMGSLAVTAMRNARRGGGGISAQAAAANESVAEQFPGADFVTGLLLQIDIASGSVTAINAGHCLALLLRAGTVEELGLAPDLPLGLQPGAPYRQQEFRLRSGDRLLMLTDGITEAHHVGGPAFGGARVSELLTTLAHLPPAEFVRQLTNAVLEFRGGDLGDDATAVCLDWR